MERDGGRKMNREGERSIKRAGDREMKAQTHTHTHTQQKLSCRQIQYRVCLSDKYCNVCLCVYESERVSLCVYVCVCSMIPQK